MKLTDVTRHMLRVRRERSALLADGYEEVGESGGRLWELRRGRRIGHVITDVKIGQDGKTLFIKTAPRGSFSPFTCAPGSITNHP